MWGSNTFKIVAGNRAQIGYKYLDLPVPEGGVIPKGTWIDDYVDGSTILDCTGQLATGGGVGFLTQAVDEEGLTGLQGFQNFIIGQHDNPAKNGTELAIAIPEVGMEIEYEGAGTAIPGNLVCTSGTGALSDATARDTELSTLCGCLRVAQTGEIVIAHLRQADLEPIDDEDNLRIRIRCCSPYKK